MKKAKMRGNEIKGHLDIIITDHEDKFEGNVEKWQEVYIHGDPEGLKSLAKLLVKIGNLDQEKDDSMPDEAREHYHLKPNIELGKSSVEVIVGRLDAKGTGEFYDNYIPKDIK